jgi:hypothetical protein
VLNEVVEPMISQYLISTCLFTIDKFNEKYKGIKNKEDLKRIADEEFNELDLTVRLGYPFRQMAYFDYRTNKGNLNKQDIYVKDKDFKIEVKFLRNYANERKNSNSNSSNWDALEMDFLWLTNEIQNGNKNRSAFVIGWFNAIDYFGQIAKLGKAKGGRYPDWDPNKMDYFQFLRRNGPKTRDLEIAYEVGYEEISFVTSKLRGNKMHSMFLGKETDKFHIALYW